MNIIPFPVEPETDCGFVPEDESNSLPRTNPKVQDSADLINSWVTEPKKADFKYIRLNKELIDLQSDYIEQNRKSIEQLEDLGPINFTEREIKVYEILAKMERELSWEKLLSMRSKLFLMEQEENKGVNTTFVERDDTVNETEFPKFNPNMSINEISFIAVKDRDRKTGVRLQSELEGEEEELKENSFTKIEERAEKKRLNESINRSTVIDWEKKKLKITEETLESVESSRDIIKQPIAPPKPQLFIVPELDADTKEEFLLADSEVNLKRKRLCSKTLDTFFLSLYDDLNCLHEWQKEEEYLSKIVDKELLREEEEERVSGRLWLLRGQLAERLCRQRLAEKAYRRCLEKGQSFLATHRLLKLYANTGNTKAVLILIAEMMDSLERSGPKEFDFLPLWIKDHLHTIVHKQGLRHLKAVIKELKLEDETIQNLLEEIPKWIADGFDR